MKSLETKMLCAECTFTCMKEIFDEDDLRKINENKSETQIPQGRYIIQQGNFISQVVFIKQGLAKIVLEGKNGRASILQIVEKRNFIALPMLSKPDIYPFSVIAVTDCEICYIRKETFREIIEGNIKAHRFIMNWYSSDYQYFYSRFETISNRNNHGKVAAAILYLSNGNFSENILPYLSRKDLAELASVSVDSSNKILMQLKQDEIIEIDKDGIHVLRLDLLEKLSLVG